MIFTKQEVLDSCKKIAPVYGLDPLLVYAVTQRESEKDKKTGEYDPSAAALEEGYYRKYTMKMDLATSSEILFAASWGIMQMMGLSLKENGYFERYYKSCSESMKQLLQHPLSQFAIPSALDAHVVNLDSMVDEGSRWLLKKIKLAGGDISKGLLFWNGGADKKYGGEVFALYQNFTTKGAP